MYFLVDDALRTGWDAHSRAVKRNCHAVGITETRRYGISGAVDGFLRWLATKQVIILDPDTYEFDRGPRAATWMHDADAAAAAQQRHR